MVYKPTNITGGPHPVSPLTKENPPFLACKTQLSQRRAMIWVSHAHLLAEGYRCDGRHRRPWTVSQWIFRMVPPSFVCWFKTPSKYIYIFIYNYLRIIHYCYNIVMFTNWTRFRTGASRRKPMFFLSKGISYDPMMTLWDLWSTHVSFWRDLKCTIINI